MKCTVLVENSSLSESLESQHGLSFLIEFENHIVLLDSGQNDMFARNAEKLGINIAEVDTAVVSHPHYDHAGGIDTFCKINTKAPVYTYWNQSDEYYSTSHNETERKPRWIGFHTEKYTRKRLRTVDNTTVTKLFPGCTMVPITVHAYGTPYKDKTLFVRHKNQTELSQDKFESEGILVFETHRGRKTELVLFNSCSHNGVINSIESVKLFFPNKKISAYIGGFHFPWQNGDSIASEDIEAMNDLVSYVQKKDIVLYTGHCTGEAALSYLEQKTGDKIHRLSTGLVTNL